MDTVVGYRKRYNEQIGKEESDKKWVKLIQETEVNWETVKVNIKAEKEKEAKVR